MKHLSVIISALFSILCIGCIKEDYDIGKKMMFRMSIRSGFWSIHEFGTVYSNDLPRKHRGLSVQRGSPVRRLQKSGSG